MRYHVATLAGQWIGGCDYRRSEQQDMIEHLQRVSVMWQQTIIATRVDRRGGQHGTRITVSPDGRVQS